MNEQKDLLFLDGSHLSIRLLAKYNRNPVLSELYSTVAVIIKRRRLTLGYQIVFNAKIREAAPSYL